jgi:AcrR family transcriptional regulator
VAGQRGHGTGDQDREHEGQNEAERHQEAQRRRKAGCAMAEGRRPYHRGDLRAALLRAGEEVLAESGVEAFSLRHVAKRVGVSHSAPAHHFGDAAGLLIALAAEGFRRFLGSMQARQVDAGGAPIDLLVASGFGYIGFARQTRKGGRSASAR